MANKIRQEINILDALLSAAGGASATSNEIRLLDINQYHGATFYFEIVADSTISISFNVTLNGATDGTLATCNVPLLTTAFTLIRSSSFTPTTASQNVTVVIDNTAGATKNVKSARIVILQSATSLLTATETLIDLGTASNSTSLSDVALTNPKYWKYTSANWDSFIVVYFEGVFLSGTSKSACTMTLQVADGTGDGFVNWTNVAGSAVTTVSTTPVRVRSSAITLTAGRNYRAVMKAGNSKSGITVYSANIVIDSPSWTQVGNGLSIATTSPSIASLTATRIALYNNADGKLGAYDFDGTNWSLVGTALTITSGTLSALAALSSTRVAYIDIVNGQLRTYDFDGSTWSQVGNSFTLAVGAPALAALSSTRVAFADVTVDRLRAYDFDGTNWSLVGNSLTLSLGSVALAALSSIRVALVDINLGALRAYDFDGTNWSLVGNSFALSNTSASLAALSSTRIAFTDALDTLRIYDFDGTNWSLASNLFPIVTNSTAISMLSATSVAFIDDGFDELRTYRLNALGALEPQYLLAPYLLAAGTALQIFLTKWDSTEWSGFTNVYTAATDAANGSASDTEIDTAAGTTVTGSTVTNPDNQGFSSSMTMPADGNLDCKATTNNSDLFAVRILVSAILTLAPPIAKIKNAMQAVKRASFF